MGADGQPTAVYYTPPPSVSSPFTSTGHYRVRSSSLEGISDEAIEECFPPSDDDLAEIECMEQYINLLCHLDALETFDNYLRKHGHLPKRWAAKRREGVGVGGAPKAARTIVVPDSPSSPKGSSNENVVQQLVGSPRHRLHIPGVDYSFKASARNAPKQFNNYERKMHQPGGRMR